MITSFPTSRSFRPLGMAHASLMIVLALSPALVRMHLEQRHRTQTRVEFQSTRQQLLSRIQAAAGSHDLDALLAIDRRYSEAISDRAFSAVLKTAIADASARKTELELTVSRYLDFARHHEEVSLGPDTSRPQLPNDEVPGSRLSVLPR